MVLEAKRIGALVLRLIVGLALLGCPRVGNAQGTWSVISLPPKPGDVDTPNAMAVDAAGNLYVAEFRSDGYQYRIQKRDAQGNWSVIATHGRAVGQVFVSYGLAVDTVGNLYVTDWQGQLGGGRIQKRDAQGNWSVIATNGTALGQLFRPTSIAVDAAGNLYVADGEPFYHVSPRIQKRDAQGNWSVIAAGGIGPGQVLNPRDLAVDSAGNLYVADDGYDSATGKYVSGSRIQKQDAQGNWSLIATGGSAPGQVQSPTALAADAAGNLYVADTGRIQKRDAQGNWSVVATGGTGLGQINGPATLAVDAAGNLYVPDVQLHPTGGSYWRIQKRDAQGNWFLIATRQGWYPSALAVDGPGNLYAAVAEVIWKRDAQGNWSENAPGGTGLGQVSLPTALAADTAGDLYVAESGRIQKRDAQGNWSILATGGREPGQVLSVYSLAVDGAGNLYVAEAQNGGDPCIFGGICNDRIQKRDAQGNWSVTADSGGELGQVHRPRALAADVGGNLYVADSYDRIQKREPQGNWSEIATEGDALGQVYNPTALAADGAGNLYVAEYYRIQKRDAQGNWSVIAAEGSALGQVLGGDYGPGLAAGRAGNLYVADTNNNRVQKYTPQR